MKTYSELCEASKASERVHTERALELLASLEAIDPDFVTDALELWAGKREVLALYLMQPIPALGGDTCYEKLAAGERGRVVQLFNAVRHGIYL